MESRSKDIRGAGAERGRADPHRLGVFLPSAFPQSAGGVDSAGLVRGHVAGRKGDD